MSIHVVLQNCNFFFHGFTERSDLTVVDIAGLDVPAAHIGDLAAGSIETTNNIHSANNIIAGGGLNVGPGGIKSDGPVAINHVLNLTPSASAPANPFKGDIYCDTFGDLYFYNGSGWHTIDMTSAP